MPGLVREGINPSPTLEPCFGLFSYLRQAKNLVSSERPVGWVEQSETQRR